MLNHYRYSLETFDFRNFGFKKMMKIFDDGLIRTVNNNVYPRMMTPDRPVLDCFLNTLCNADSLSLF